MINFNKSITFKLIFSIVVISTLVKLISFYKKSINSYSTSKSSYDFLC